MDDQNGVYDRYVDSYLECFERYGQSNFLSFRPIPSMTEVEHIVEDLMELLFPGRSGRRVLSDDCIREVIAALFNRIGENLEKQMPKGKYILFCLARASEIEDCLDKKYDPYERTGIRPIR